MFRSIVAAGRLAQTARQAATVRSFSAAASKQTSASEDKAATSAATVKKMKKTKPVDGLVDSPSSSWVPDPVTGYYRPGNRAAEIDPAELRRRLLSKRH